VRPSRSRVTASKPMRRALFAPSLVGLLLCVAGCSLELQHDLSEDDANEIYVLMQKKGINAAKVKEGEGKEARYVISVPKGKVRQAAELLREYSLPRPRADGLAIFKQTKGMIPTQTEERAMFIEALGGEISNALNRIPGVLESRTIVMIPEVNDLTQPDKKPVPTASVLVKYMPVEGKPTVSADEVQGFVANSVPELKRENVKVLMTEAKFLSESSTEPRYDDVLGVRVDSESATPVRVLLGVFALLFFGLAGAVVFLMLRKPATRAPPRAKTQEG
jgi:type III secretion protein J